MQAQRAREFRERCSMSVLRAGIVVGFAITGIAVCSIAILADATVDVSFPEEYRAWAHVKTVLVGPESNAFSTEAGIHHIYANDEALVGYRTGSFPDGSVIVYDLLDAVVVQGNTIEGPQRRVDVMVKDARRYPDTGGWAFGRFTGTDRSRSTLSPELQAGCFTCHSTRGDRDSVFSEFRR